jgi:hypothetical protein
MNPIPHPNRSRIEDLQVGIPKLTPGNIHVGGF